jgi:hypothetical protein
MLLLRLRLLRLLLLARGLLLLLQVRVCCWAAAGGC